MTTTSTTTTTKASITLDYANCLAPRIGDDHGIETREFEAAAKTMNPLTERLAQMRAAGEIRWRDLPRGELRRHHVDAVRAAVDGVHAHFEKHAPKKRCKHMVVLGIGGSALGNIALQAALRPHTHNYERCADRSGPRLYVLDNVDPLLVGDTMRRIERADPTLEHTLVNVISKSGETAETAAQFMIFRNWLRSKLGAERYPKHIVAITDPKQGTMRDIVDREGYRSLPVPDGVGGRFSVLSPVGLFSAAMCDIDIEALLDGAASMDTRCARPFAENPAAILAWLLIAFAKRGKPNHVLMPYANGLYMLADWYRQLWAESLGKRVDLDGREVFAGATPIKALGTTDQHSQVQLYREGPNDKVIGFVEVERFRDEVEIPRGLGVANLEYLEGQTLGALLNAEKRATEYALLESERPNFTIRFPEVNEATVGEFIMLWEVATAYAGLLFNINAYDQPAVETGKVATFGLMGRAGYEEWRTRVEARFAQGDG
ncbi:MAG: glucose-6-phosphate isomerase [Phycisphaerales bacterium]